MKLNFSTFVIFQMLQTFDPPRLNSKPTLSSPFPCFFNLIAFFFITFQYMEFLGRAMMILT